MERVCVYCGSSPGSDSAYLEAAEAFGRRLAERGAGLVYGGGRVGMMGAVADAALGAGGEVHGVVPESLVEREIAHESVTKLEVVGSMHERKRRMADLSEGFVALPGGYGTLEELIEVVTWSQLGLHRKPCGLLNAAGYYDRLIDFFDHQVREGFVSEDHREMVVVAPDPDELLDRFESYESPPVKEYVTDPEET